MIKRRVPNIVRGGTAVPLGRNYYYMSGRKHEQGGIDIGRNPRTGLEVEDGEVMHVGKNEIKVFSAQPFLNGKSPAQRVMNGDNPNDVFNAQEKYKRLNKLNDDGTKKKRMGGLSRNKDYGSSKKPYPNIKSKDFAGGHRSYPIPTKADARDALRLAGLHGRSDVKAKVYAKYPDLRKKARNGGLYSITVNGKTTLKSFPKRKKAALGTDNEYNNRNLNSYGYMLGPMNWGRDVASNDIAGNVLRWTFPSGDSNDYPQFNELVNDDSSTGKSTSRVSRANKVNTSTALARRGTPTKRTYSGLDIPDNGNLDIAGINTITPNITSTITPNTDNINVQPIDLNVSTRRRFGNRIGSFFRNAFSGNNIPTLIGGIANFIGNNRSYKANKEFINSLRYANSPIQTYAPKLKTRINIAPQLDAMRESLANYERNINNNTASSQVALARNRAARLNNILLANGIYGNKENKETELINNDRINRGNVAAKNIESYNNYQNGLAAFRNAVAEKNAENEVSRISNNVANIQNIINSLSQNRNFGNTLIAQMATAPNVNPEYLKALGADWVTDEMIKNYKKANKKG